VNNESKLFDKDGQKEMKEFILRIKNNLSNDEFEDRETYLPKFAEPDNKALKNKVVIEFDEDLVV